MNMQIVWSFSMGLVLGIGFAALQWLALTRHELLEKQAQLPRIWRFLPGSAARVALLLMALLLVQVLAPAADLKWLAVGLLTAKIGRAHV